MSPTRTEATERYRRLRDLVDRAAERPEAEWVEFLEQECPADPDLRIEVMHLLEQDRAARAEGFLEPSPPTVIPSWMELADQDRGPNLGEPSKLGKYEIVERFSERSGQAAAYKAFDPDLRRHVVLKRYNTDTVGMPAEIEEGRALARVQSPYVAACFGIERIGGEAFLVVEFIPGRNLAQVQRDEHMPLERMIRIIALLSNGVSAVHARGLIHRDIKPANVILHDDGNPRLVDFGLAAHLGSDHLCNICGTPQYMAPEQARGEWDRIDQRVDIFGLGALLYKLLTGHAPHEGASVSESLDRARKGDIAPPRQLDPTIPAPLEAVCLKALSSAPDNRYSTAVEFAAALRQAIEPTPVTPLPPARISSWLRRTMPAEEASNPDLPGGRPRWLIPTGIALASTIVLGTIGVLAGRSFVRDTPHAGNDVPTILPSVSIARSGDGKVEGILPSTEASSSPAVLRFEITHFPKLDAKRFDPRRVGILGRNSFTASEDDEVTVRAELSTPAYTFLIAFRPDGTHELCDPDDEDALPPRKQQPLYPPTSKSDERYRLSEGVGLHAFALVVSSEPLPPYREWKRRMASMPWAARLSGEPGVVWRVNDQGLDSLLAGDPAGTRGKGVKARESGGSAEKLATWLRGLPGVDAVTLEAFLVEPSSGP